MLTPPVIRAHPTKEGAYSFRCPGCGEEHLVATQDPNGTGMVWGFNQSLARPTFTPSLLFRSGHFIPGYESPRCWCNYHSENPDEPAPFRCGICHSFVLEGQMQFLNDCTHALAGQTVPLPSLPG